MSKRNSNEHMVISIAKLDKSIDLREDLRGTLPELTSLLSYYIVHFCQHFSKQKVTEDGHNFSAETILNGIMIATAHNIKFPLQEEETDE